MRRFCIFALLSLTACVFADPFDEKTAYEMWDLNSLTLCNQREISEMKCKKCIPFKGRLTNTTVIKNIPYHVSGFIGLWENKDIMISFRATEGIINIIQDLTSAILGSAPFCQGCKASGTFLEIYSSIHEKILSTVKPLLLEHPNASLVLTGHSSGAVYALYSAIDIITNFSKSHLRSEPIQVRYFYSFGMPRIGNNEFVEHLHKYIPNHYRITHNKDMIPLLPPKLSGFKHTGDEYWYNAPSTTYTVCPYPESKNCINKVYRPNKEDHLEYMGTTKGGCDA